MKSVHQYFITHKKATLTWMWVFFFISLGYMVLHMRGFISTNFFLWLIPGAVTLYLRMAYTKASYDPKKDPMSKEYVPRQPKGKKQ